ncbi:MAG: agmatinase [Desulfobulbaceae bacterium]|nr:MAG: agmatinase [Desulfobulbaceae bacterium]
MTEPFFLEPGCQVADEEAARLVVIPVPYGATVSWLAGTEQGPAAILAASAALEVFDDELLFEPWQAGIATQPALDCRGSSEQMLMRLCSRVEKVVAAGGLPFILGGEHSLSVAGVAACLRHYADLCVVQVDAHLDLRQEYEGDWLSHACVMRRIDDLAVPFIQVGIRSFCREEWQLCTSQGRQPWTMARMAAHDQWLADVVAAVKGRPFYLTFDLDGLDPAVLPATGTPEPDGLSWRMATGLIGALCRAAPLVGADFVELAPPVGPAYSAFTAAKLIYRTMGYAVQRQSANLGS